MKLIELKYKYHPNEEWIQAAYTARSVEQLIKYLGLNDPEADYVILSVIDI